MCKKLKNIFVGMMFLFMPTLALADTTLTDVLQHALDYLTSTPARVLATIAIVGVGYASWHLGKIPKERAIAIIVGIGIVFGATTLLNILVGG